ncbi:MAG: aminotransferase class I/II-fold pyridoxal phosphate-dependent enzyme [Candidatus Aenigmatarchaeota archaeon]
MIIPSKRTKELRYAIRDVLIPAKKLEKKGKKIYYFNIGDPNKFDFDTPDYLKEELIRIIKEEKTGHYGDSEGEIKLRESIVERENKKNRISINTDDVIITHGISEGIEILLSSIIEPGRGDEILIGGPAYPVYVEMTKFLGGIPVTYRCIEENGWEPDIEDLRKKVSKKTKAIVVVNPNNPTGSVFGKEILKEIVKIADENGTLLIGDEIYDQLIFGKKEHHGLASLSKNTPSIIFNGFSKSYLIPGWRIGYMYFNDPSGSLNELKEAVLQRARLRLSCATPLMKACAIAYRGPQNHIKEINRKLRERAEFAYKRLNEINRISTQKPEGAFYIFPRVDIKGKWKSDKEFCLELLNETGVLFPPGSGFDETYGHGHFRSIILPPLEIMEEAFDKVDEFMKNAG